LNYTGTFIIVETNGGFGGLVVVARGSVLI